MADAKNSHDPAGLARAQPLFARLEDEEMGSLMRHVARVELVRGEVLFRPGDAVDALWALEAPAAVAIYPGEPGEGVPLALVQGGEVLGEGAFIRGSAHLLTAVVAQGGPAFRMRGAELKRLRERGEAVAFKLLRQMALDLCLRIRRAATRVAPAEVVPACAPVDFSDGRAVEPSEIDLYPAFRGAAGTARLALEQMLREKGVERGEVVMRQGEPGRALLCVASGEVEVRWRWGAVTRVGTGGVFGLVSLIDGGDCIASAVAAEPSRIWWLPAEDFEVLYGASHPFGHALVEVVARGLVARLRSANAALLAQGAAEADAALARVELSRAPAVWWGS